MYIKRKKGIWLDAGLCGFNYLLQCNGWSQRRGTRTPQYPAGTDYCFPYCNALRCTHRPRMQVVITGCRDKLAMRSCMLRNGTPGTREWDVCVNLLAQDVQHAVLSGSEVGWCQSGGVAREQRVSKRCVEPS